MTERSDRSKSSQPIPIETIKNHSVYEHHPSVSLYKTDSDSPEESERFNNEDLQTFVTSATHHYSSQIVNNVPNDTLFDSVEHFQGDQYIISQNIMRQLDLIPSINTRITTDNIPNYHRPYPPMIRSGVIDEHDRPFADYGHLDAASIATSCHFDLDGKQNRNRREKDHKRMEGKSWAITAWSAVSKTDILNEIRRQFYDTRLQYVCIASEKSTNGDKSHMHIQIITNQTINKTSWFLDDITGTHCNYQITNNDKAWNEYIKKGGDFIEFGEFKSPKSRGTKLWPELPPQPPFSSSNRSSESNETNERLIPPVSVPTTSRRNFVEERRQRKMVTAQRALLLAETDVTKAMDLVREAMPVEFMTHSSWYLATFNYVRLQAQKKLCQTNVIDTKKYQWPTSFPDCTPNLQRAMNRWIRHHFSRKSRAKCLILIGPTGTGKTSFALSLPGIVNYFKGRWHLDNWNHLARYCVFDDIGWDHFEKLNYPSKKDLLTQNGLTGATDKYRHSTMINIVQPAIVLLNPGNDEGSLASEPRTKEAEEDMKYWKKRAFIYRMGPDEYFYKRTRKMNRNDSDSSNSTTVSDDEHSIELGLH